MKTLCLSLTLLASSLFAQDEYFWTLASKSPETATAAWADNQNQSVFVSTYSLGSWSEPEEIPGSENTCPWPILLEEDTLGNLILVWANSYSGIYSSIKRVGFSWTTANLISPEEDYCLEPVLSLDAAGNATVLYLNFSEGLQACRLPLGSTNWSSPVNITNP